MKRVVNFYPGPAALPLEALEAAKEEFLDFRGSGMSVMEISHRSKEYEAVHNETQDLMRELFHIPQNYKLLMLQGGATLQFAMIPMNLLGDGETADYIVTGSFSKNAYKAASKIRSVHLAATTEEDGKFFRIPKQSELDLRPGAVYCHITSNNTIFGTQWHSFPDTGTAPLVADMSSDILSKKVDLTPFGLIYAGAQKNLGPAGVTMVIIRDDLVERSREDLPDILNYKVHASKNSLFNTPACFAIYIMNKVLNWAKNKGGLDVVEKENREKARLLYGVIDHHAGFYQSKVEKESRSWMNVTFRLPTEELEGKFISDGQKEGFIGLKGHRSVGGIRISIYNANGISNVKALVQFMEGFAANHG